MESTDDLYERCTEYERISTGVFCCIKTDAIMVFFQGFQKKTKKTPFKELKMAEW